MTELKCPTCSQSNFRLKYGSIFHTSGLPYNCEMVIYPLQEAIESQGPIFMDHTSHHRIEYNGDVFINGSKIPLEVPYLLTNTLEENMQIIISFIYDYVQNQNILG